MKTVSFNSAKQNDNGSIVLILDPPTKENMLIMSKAEARFMSSEILTIIKIDEDNENNAIKHSLFKKNKTIHNDDACTMVMDMLSHQDDIYKILSELSPSIKSKHVDKIMKALGKLCIEIGALHAQLDKMR